MKPHTHQATRKPPLQKVKEGFRRNGIEYTERVDRGCTVLEAKRKPEAPPANPATPKQAAH